MFTVVKEGKLHTFDLLLFPSCARGISPTRCYPTKLGNMTTLSESFAKTETERFVNESEIKQVCQKPHPTGQQILKFNATSPVMAAS